MSKRVYLKDEQLEYRLIRRRLLVSAAIVLLMMLALLIRLYVLQVVSHEHFSTLSDSNRVRIKALPPARGLIFDRNGVVVANNLPAWRLEIIREEVDDLETTLLHLKQYVDYSERDLKRYRRSLRRRRPFESLPLKLNLSDEEVASLAVNLHKFKGVEINARLARNYPFGSLGVHALGYVNRIDEDDLGRVDEINYAGTSHIGKIGLERYYEKALHGTVGIQQVEVNAQGRTLRVLDEKPPVPGVNLHLTIDSKLQRVAEQAFGDYTGSVVAIDPANGEILAFVSMPTFDPNLFVNGIGVKDYGRLRGSASRPLFNRALSGQYPPGSTVKPFFGLAGLEGNTVGREQKVHCPGYFQLENDERKYRDWKKEGHGSVDVKKAIVESCDVYHYQLSYWMGIDKMSAFMAQFGLGQKTGIDSIGEKRGLLPSREWKRATRSMPWFPGETLITGIGQGALLVTPLQLANATAALSAKGKRFRPRLVQAIESADSGQRREIDSEQTGQYQLVKELNWETILKSMQEVVDSPRGTAHVIGKGLQYSIAGKTGTAQVFGIAQDEEYDHDNVSAHLRDHALFVSFAPAEAPRIAVAVIVENGSHGGSVAAPIARKVMDAYLLGQS